MVAYIAYLRKDEDSDFGVEFPDLPGCVSAGRTLDEARAMAAEALAGHVAALEVEGANRCRRRPPWMRSGRTRTGPTRW